MNLLENRNIVHINDLNKDEAKYLQRLLQKNGYHHIAVDGIVGNITRTAFNDFKKENWLGEPDVIGHTTLGLLENNLGNKVDKYDFSTKENTIKAITAECKKQGLILKTQIAYVLATTEWETKYTFKPVREAYWLSEQWRKNNLHYYPWYGRGFSQLTWETNYRKYGNLLKIDLVNNPDLALDPYNACFILVHGCKNGTFTGRKIEDYITTSKTDYINARRVINGTDRASDIASLAVKWAINSS